MPIEVRNAYVGCIDNVSSRRWLRKGWNIIPSLVSAGVALFVCWLPGVGLLGQLPGLSGHGIALDVLGGCGAC